MDEFTFGSDVEVLPDFNGDCDFLVVANLKVTNKVITALSLRKHIGCGGVMKNLVNAPMKVAALSSTLKDIARLCIITPYDKDKADYLLKHKATLTPKDNVLYAILHSTTDTYIFESAKVSALPRSNPAKATIDRSHAVPVLPAVEENGLDGASTRLEIKEGRVDTSMTPIQRGSKRKKNEFWFDKGDNLNAVTNSLEASTQVDDVVISAPLIQLEEKDFEVVPRACKRAGKTPNFKAFSKNGAIMAAKMTFFEKKGIWRSLLDVGAEAEKGRHGDDDTPVIPLLDEAASITRALYEEEEIRPSLVVRNKRHPHNLLLIELLTSDPTSSPDEPMTIIGSVLFHIHDLIKASPITGIYDLWNESVQVGDINLEITFSYGVFGYGYSHQLREEDTSAVETVQYSVFPRLTPRREQREQDDPVLVVCAVPHPPFVPFTEEVYLSYGKDIRSVLEDAKEAAYQPEVLQNALSSIESIRDEVGAVYSTVARV
ncbi:hypothetical protein HK405_004697 [Cladochytrium tenue]|nr:hypothetical protein HK405_004697 [Cladochytrium tenue]